MPRTDLLCRAEVSSCLTILTRNEEVTRTSLKRCDTDIPDINAFWRTNIVIGP